MSENTEKSPEENIDLYESLMREKEVIFDGIKSANNKTRQAMTEMIQTIQMNDGPNHNGKEEKLNMIKSLLLDVENNSKKVEKNESILTKIISDFHKKCPTKLAILKRVFDHIKAHQDQFENMSEKERRQREAELSSSEEKLLYRLISLGQMESKLDAKIFETILSEIKASYTTGTSVIGVLSQSLVDSKKDIESTVSSTAAYLSAIPPNSADSSE